MQNTASNMAMVSLVEHSPVYDIPGIGRRTAALLHHAGVTTVGTFAKLPDLLLEHTFGPSMPVLRRRVADMLRSSSQQQFANLIKRFARQLIA